jgi:hypothetical protein
MNISKKTAAFRIHLAIVLGTSAVALGCAGVSKREVQPLPTPGSVRPEPTRPPAMPIIVEHSPNMRVPAPANALAAPERRPPQLSPIVVSEPLAPNTESAPANVPPQAAAASPAPAPAVSKPASRSTSSVPTQPAAPKAPEAIPPPDATQP